MDKFSKHLLEQKEPVPENKFITKQFLSNSTTNNFIFGFSMNKQKYVIRLQKIMPEEYNYLWELKIAKLNYSKDLKEHDELQADIGTESLENYIKVIIDMLVQLRNLKTDKSEIHGLLFNLPEQLKNRQAFFLRLKNLLRNTHLGITDGLKSENSPLSIDSGVNWFLFFRNHEELKKIFKTDDMESEVNDILDIHSKIHIKTLNPVLPKGSRWYPAIDEVKTDDTPEKDSEMDDIVQSYIKKGQENKQKFIDELPKESVLKKLNEYKLPTNFSFTFSFEYDYNFLLGEIPFLHKFGLFKSYYISRPVEVRLGYNYLQTKRDDFNKVLDFLKETFSLEEIISQVGKLTYGESKTLHEFSLIEWVNWFQNYIKNVLPKYSQDQIKSVLSFKTLENPNLFLFEFDYNFLKDSNHTKEETVFHDMLYLLINQADINEEHLRNLSFNDEEELNDARDRVKDFEFDTEEFPKETQENFKAWMLDYLNKTAFFSKQDLVTAQVAEFFSPKERELSEEQKELKKFKPYYNVFKMMKGKGSNYVSTENLKYSVPGNTDEERIQFLVDLSQFFNSKFLKDTFNSSELETIEEQFKGHYTPLDTDQLDDMNDELEMYFDSISSKSEFDTAFRYYSLSNYQNINNLFRKKEQHPSLVLDNVLDQIKAYYMAPTQKYPLITIRGSASDKWLKDKISGDYVIESGFFSSSISKEVAEGFADKGNMFGNFYLIYIPEGLKGIYIANMSEFRTEMEFLQPPGSIFKIISIENRAYTTESSLKGDYGLIYKLLYIGSITKSLMNESFKGTNLEDEWKEFSKDIELKEV